MSHSGSDTRVTEYGRPRPGRRRAARGPSRAARLLRTLVFILIIAALVFAFMKVKDMLGGPDDYSGQGTGKVVIEVPEGANGQQIADILASKDVVKSAEAYYQVSLNDPRAQSVQPGFYQLRKQMSAKAALGALVDKKNRVEGRVAVPEGANVDQIIGLIEAGSEISKKDVVAALEKPQSLGLPKDAAGNPEGYLFPATYTVEPGTSATDRLKQMVAKAADVYKSMDIASRAQGLGYSSAEIITVASLLEREAQRGEDFPKVARVLYNRLDDGMALQLDSTVQYVSKRKGDVFTTPEERANPSAYNTYKNSGLPPGPIGSPGKQTIEAALNPAEGPWLYFVTVNLETGETVFTNTNDEHSRAVAELQEYCKGTDIC